MKNSNARPQRTYLKQKEPRKICAPDYCEVVEGPEECHDKTLTSTIGAVRFSSFKLNMERIPEYRGKHILLVDDVLTTGSTLEACGSQLLQIPGVKLSLLTMAVAEG